MGSQVDGGNSLYSLTLGEVQSKFRDLGKPLGSMNLTELLKQICTTSSLDQMTLSNKTVNEVWRDIQLSQKRCEGQLRQTEERQPALGEVTLKDFLLKAGVVSDSSPLAEKNGGTVLAFGSCVTNTACSENQTHVQPDIQISMRKRVASVGIVEKTNERRKKRMIKNRESAARSRARKQAYTHELENKVLRLEEENERLRKRKEVELEFPGTQHLKQKSQLRRTSSAHL